jgi:hypothetical protein
MAAVRRVVNNENAPTHLEHSNVRGGAMSAASIDAAGLEFELRARINGEVRFDDGARALHATDSSHYRQVPIGVVIPRDAEDVVETVMACRRSGAPIVVRGEVRAWRVRAAMWRLLSTCRNTCTPSSRSIRITGGRECSPV